MIKYLKIFFILTLLTNLAFGQGDCPGQGERFLTGSTYYWYWSGTLTSPTTIRDSDSTYSSNHAESVVRNYIQEALDAWCGHADDVVSFEESQSTGTNTLEFFFEADDDPLHYGQYYDTFRIRIDAITWADDDDLEGIYPDIYTVILHEIGHAFAFLDAATGTTIMNYQAGQIKGFTSCDIATLKNLYNPQDTLVFKNDFGSGGKMNIDNHMYYNIPDTGITKIWGADDFPKTSVAQDGQDIGDYIRIWKIWSDNETDSAHTFGTGDGGEYTAQFYKEFDIDFTNKYGTSGTGGIIEVKGSQDNSPTSDFQVREDLSIDADAINQTINGIYFTFESWTKDGGQTIPPSEMTSGSPPFIPTDHTTYECNLQGKPVNTYRNLSLNYGDIGEEIELNWSAHPDTDVEGYIIWRKVKNNGVMGEALKLDSLGRTTTTYTDIEYIVANTTWINVFYDVQAYYAPDQTYADHNYIPIYAEAGHDIKTNDASIAAIVEEVPTAYSIGNYPNPFNPSTIIQYTLPENDFVTLKIYDMLGKEISTLVKEKKSAGTYNVEFDASRLPSGVYIYSIVTNKFRQSKKMILTK